MNLKVKETFRDKYTGEIYEEGKVIKVEKDRGEELLKSPYVVVEEVKPDNKNEKNNKKDDAKKAEVPEKENEEKPEEKAEESKENKEEK